MTMFPKSVAFGLALLSSLAIAPVSVITTFRHDAPMAVAQTPEEPTAFPLPESVATDTIVRVDGSSSMTVLNTTLKQRFEEQYAGTTVELSSQGTDVALDALRNGSIDLAAVGRPLTEQEREQGFVEVPISREKIAIIVGAANPFDGNLTFEQFAQMFRGEITNWSDVGGESRPIRFVDRDEMSDTRLSLSRYEVFQAAPFQTGDTAITVDDDTSAVIDALGATGIGYAIASQVINRDDVNIISMHQTLPDNPAYPYSQPRGYVYYEEPSEAASAFLGFATADAGQAAVQEAKEAEAEAVEPAPVASQAQGLDVPPIGGILYSTSLAYSPDGERVAAASDNGTVRIFDADGNPVGEPLSGLPGQLSSLAFSPDGTRLVGATNDGSIQFWNLDGTPIGNPLTGHDSAITSVVFSPDGESIATAGADGTIWRWDLEGNQIGDPFRGHEGAINGLAFRPDGDAIASAGADGTVRLWDVEGTPIGDPLTGHSGAVNSVAFDEQGETIASAGGDGTVRLWELDGTPIGEPLVGHTGAVNSVAFIPGTSELVSAGTDGSLRFWNREGESTGVVEGDAQGAIAALALSPDGTSMVTGGADGTLQPRTTEGEPVGDPIDGYISSVTPARGKLPTWIWWLLPLALLALLLWWLSRRRSSDTAPEGASQLATETPTGRRSSTAPPDPSAVSPYLAAALAAAEAGKTNEALENFDKAVRDEPTNTLAWTARGNLLNQLGRSDDALGSFDKALNIQADLPQALVGKGTALTKLGRATDALPVFDRAMDATNRLPAFNAGNLAPGGLLLGGTALTVKALSGKGFALLDTHQPEAALEAFDAALSHDSRSVDAIAGRNRALGLIGTGRHSPSPDTETPSLSVSPRLASALALVEVGKTNEALSALDQTVKDEPENALAWTVRGNLLSRMNRSDDALGSFDRALSIHPGLPQALVGKGTTLVKAGKAEDGLPLFDQAITTPRDGRSLDVSTLATGGLLLGGGALTAKALSGKGYALLDTQKPQAALTSFDAALSHDARSVDAIAGRNRALGVLSGETAETPTRVTPRLASALALADIGKTDEALAALDQTVKEEPENLWAWIARGNLFNQLKRSTDAASSFDTALGIQSDSAQAYVGKGEALTKLGRPDEAIALFDQSATANDTLASSNLMGLATGGLLFGGTALIAKALTGKGTALLNAQNPQDALTSFDAALGHDPENEAAIAGRNRALELLNRADASSSPLFRSPAASSDDLPSRRTAGLAGAGMGAPSMIGGDRDQTTVESKKFDVGQTDLSAEDLADVDQGLPDLPEGYGESRIMLLPRDPQWAFAYWDVPNDHKEELRQQGGQSLALRLYDVTDIDIDHQNPHSVQQYPCDEMARDWYMPIPVSDRDYLVELGYVTNSGDWLRLARSAPVHVPPVYPSDWVGDQFLTVNWGDDLKGKTLTTLVPPDQGAPGTTPIHDHVFGLAQSVEALRVAGSLFGSMQQVPQAAISSYVFPSGMGMWTTAGASGAGLTMSGIGMSGVGFSASMPPIRPRKFWLVADAELIVYGATEPDAKVTIGGTPIQLGPDGTFRFQMSFQDGEIDFPIQAVAADGEQTRSIHMEFERETPAQNTNTKDEAVDEWFDS